MRNLIIDAHESWNEFLNRESIKMELDSIDTFLTGKDYNPSNKNILRFLKNDLSKVKVVIIGQDTYPARGVATGRAFEVGGLESWLDPFRQISLKNIVRNLYGSYTDKTSYTSFNEIKKNIHTGDFDILAPNQLFESWENQGVLLLNGALTCEVGEPGSHSDMWRNFMIEVFKYISEYNKEIIFFLWGTYANSFKDILNNNKIYSSRHPMMCSIKYSDDFLKNRCFYDTKHLVDWLGV